MLRKCPLRLLCLPEKANLATVSAKIGNAMSNDGLLGNKVPTRPPVTKRFVVFDSPEHNVDFDRSSSPSSGCQGHTTNRTPLGTSLDNMGQNVSFVL